MEEEAVRAEPLKAQDMAQVAALSKRAEKKWAQLDMNGNDYLEGSELEGMAAWVWSSFHPGERMTAKDRLETQLRMLEACDKDGNGKVDRREFGVYYEKVCEESFKFQARSRCATAKARFILQCIPA